MSFESFDINPNVPLAWRSYFPEVPYVMLSHESRSKILSEKIFPWIKGSTVLVVDLLNSGLSVAHNSN